MPTNEEIRAKDIVPHKTSFSAGDGFYGDGPQSFFMEAEKLLELTAQNAFDYSEFVICKNVLKNKYVNSSGALATDSNFKVYEYKVFEGSTISFTTATGGGYVAYYDDNDVLVGSVFRNNASYTLESYYKYTVPSGATKIRITNTTQIAAEPILIIHNDGRANNKLLETIAENTFISTVIPIEILNNKYVNSSGVIASDINFKIYTYKVYEGSTISFTAATGGGYIAYYNDSDTLVGSAFRISNTYNLEAYVKYTVPSGATKIRVTSTKQIAASPTLIVHGDGRNNDALRSELDTLATGDDTLPSSLNKLPASTFVPATRLTKNLFSNDRVGNFAINRSTGTIGDVSNYPNYKCAAIPLTQGNYTISGYGDYGEWCVGLWDKTFGTRLGVKTDLYANDPNSLIVIPDGESWGSASKINVTAPRDCYLLINVKDWNTLYATSRLQVEAGTDATSYVEGVKLIPFYMTKKDGESLQSNKLLGRKLLIIGDSITDGNRYVTSLISQTGCSVYNRGVSGSSIAVRSGATDSFCERLNLSENNGTSHSVGFPSNSNVDVVIMFGGTNDWGLSVPMGAFTDAIDTSKFCGALRYMAEGLKARYPGKPIVFLSMMTAARSTRFGNWNRVTFSSDGSFVYRQNSQSKYMSDYHEAIKQVCQLYGIYFIDMFECGLSPTSEYDYEHYTLEQGDPPVPDGLHPNEAGGAIIARYIAAQLDSVL